MTTRTMMLRARRELAQDMVIVNKKSGGDAASLEYFKTVPADGYTIITFTVGQAAAMAKGQVFGPSLWRIAKRQLHPLKSSGE